MKKTISLFVLALSLMISSCKEDHKNLKDGLYAEIQTPKGTILLQLNYKKAPGTVANFVTLAEGNNPFVMADLKGKPFFDGIVFHRVEKDFVIQGGDPYGNGSGDPGYVFSDEITDLKHDKAGVVAMANSGPNTNGSQFYITLKATPQLDGGYSVFGEVVEGMDVVKKIDVNDEMTSVTIIRKGEDVKKFDAVKVFTDYFNNFKSLSSKKAEYFNNLKKTAVKTASGLSYKIIQESNGEKPKAGAVTFINYTGYLEDGSLFTTTKEELAKESGKFNPRDAMQNLYNPIEYIIGSAKLIPGLTEGIQVMKKGETAVFFIPAELAYGAQGAGKVIPPNANIIFEIELLNK